MSKSRKIKPKKLSNHTLSDEEKALFLNAIENDFKPPPKMTQAPKTIRTRQKKQSLFSRTIDLHGLTLSQAKQTIFDAFSLFMKGHEKTVKFTIVTGRGRHSGQDGPVLVLEMYAHVRQIFGPYIEKIDDDPAASMISGISLRGDFSLVVCKG